MTNNPAKLFKILAQIDQKTKTHDLSGLASKHFQNIFKTHPCHYDLIIDFSNKIAKKTEPKKDLEQFLKGIVLSKPYGTNKYLKTINENIDNNFSNIEEITNAWLNIQFQKNHQELYNKLTQLKYTNKNTPFQITTSKNPLEIQEIVKQTNACTKDDPLHIFNQIITDPGTIYLLGLDRKQLQTFREKEKGQANVSYIRLYAYQEETKTNPLLAVDNLWVNNDNKQLLMHMIDSLNEIAKYLQVNIIDQTMSKNYLMNNGHKLDIYEQEQELYKLGQPTIIERYAHMKIPKENPGFFLVKK